MRTSPNAPEAADAVVTRGLTRRFGDTVVVDPVDLAVPHGVVFGLLGPNGAGKTTLIKMLITLLAPTSGTATIAGCDVRSDPARVRRLVGYVPQLLSADGALTAEENLLVFARLYHISRSERRTRFQEALASVGLTESAKNLVRDYSGGMVFASNAIYPVALMPPALRWLAHANPLTYQTDMLRALMLQGGRSAFGLPLDFVLLLGTLVILVGVAARLYPRVVL